MKQMIILLILFNLANQIVNGQDLKQKRYIVYKTLVKDAQHNNHKGFVVTMDDSTLFMTPNEFALTFEKVDLRGLQKFNYSEITSVSLQRKKSVGRGMVIGGVGGLLVGLIVGISQPVQQEFLSDVSHAGNGVIGAAIGGGIGCLLGATIGALSHKVFNIDRKKDKLNKMQETMINRLYND